MSPCLVCWFRAPGHLRVIEKISHARGRLEDNLYQSSIHLRVCRENVIFAMMTDYMYLLTSWPVP